MVYWHRCAKVLIYCMKGLWVLNRSYDCKAEIKTCEKVLDFWSGMGIGRFWSVFGDEKASWYIDSFKISEWLYLVI